MVTYTRKGFVLQVKAKAAVDVPLFATSETTEPYSYTALQKNEKGNLSKKELHALKEFSKILLKLPPDHIKVAIENGDFVEVSP